MLWRKIKFHNYVEKNKTAYNILLKSKAEDLALISSQALFSLDVLCLFAWSLSSDLQDEYSSPADMYVRTVVKLILNQSTEIAFGVVVFKRKKNEI